MSTKQYKRLLLKLSGEILMGTAPFGINTEKCLEIARILSGFTAAGFELGVVIGGGNFFRGCNLKELGIARTPADQMGMLATLMNGVALQQSLEKIGSEAKILSALECPKIAETYTWRSALNHLTSGRIVIFSGGTGNPYFTTDTAAAMRACEIEADVLLKATKVDGVYNKDPLKYPDAIKYKTLSYSQMLLEKLEVMDATAISLCSSNSIPILVFNMKELGVLTPQEVVLTQLGTLIK